MTPADVDAAFTAARVERAGGCPHYVTERWATTWRALMGREPTMCNWCDEPPARQPRPLHKTPHSGPHRRAHSGPHRRAR